MFYSAKETLVNDTSLTVQCKQNGGHSVRENRTWHVLWQLCLCAAADKYSHRKEPEIGEKGSK